MKLSGFIAAFALILWTARANGDNPSPIPSTGHGKPSIRTIQPNWLEVDDRFIVRKDGKSVLGQRLTITILDGVRHLYRDGDCTVPLKRIPREGEPRESLLTLEFGQRHADGALDVSATRSLDFSGNVRTYTVQLLPGKLLFLDKGVSVLLTDTGMLVYEQVVGPIGPSKRSFLQASLETHPDQPFALGLAIDGEAWNIRRDIDSGRMSADPRGIEWMEIQSIRPSAVPEFLTQEEKETRRLLAEVTGDPSVRRQDSRIVLCYPRRCSKSRGFDTCRTDIGPFCQCDTLLNHFIGMCVND